MNSQHQQPPHEQDKNPEQHEAFLYTADEFSRYILHEMISKDAGVLEQAITDGLASLSTYNQNIGPDDNDTLDICLRWHFLGMVYLERFKHSHQQSDLHEAIACVESDMSVQHASDVRIQPQFLELQRSMLSARLASLLIERYRLNRAVSDLNTSLHICKQQIPIVADVDERYRIQQGSTFANSVKYLYDLTEDRSVFTEAIGFLENTISVLGVTNNRSSALADLGMLAVSRILLSAGGRYQQFEDMFKLFKESAQHSGQTKHNQIWFAHSHHRGSRLVYDMLGRSFAMEESRRLLRHILDPLDNPADTSFIRIAIDLSLCHLVTYRTQKSMADLEKALELARSWETMPATTAKDSETKEDGILVLAGCLLERSNHQGFENNISEAIQIIERAAVPTENMPGDEIIPDRSRDSLAGYTCYVSKSNANFKISTSPLIFRNGCAKKRVSETSSYTLLTDNAVLQHTISISPTCCSKDTE
jgi:hypothetical protein